jgi:thiamine-phosphate pyrophosphorylase
MKPLPSPLLVITDRHQARHSLEAIAEAVARAGGRWLLLRDKDIDPAERRALAGRLSAVARRHGMHLSVSRDVDLATEFDASVHLQSAAAIAAARERLGRNVLIGVSAHARGDVQAAAAEGADYVTLSPIFLTASKPGYGPALGVAALGDAAKLGIAVVALGGVTATTARPCLDAGADAVAVMGEIMRADDPGGAAAKLLAAIQTCTKPSAFP